MSLRTLRRGLRLLVAATLAACATAAATVAFAATEDAAAIDRFIAAQARREHGEEYREARKIATGSLTADASTAYTIVLYTIEGQDGSNNHLQYLAVFAPRGGSLAPVAHVEAGGKSVRAVDLASIADHAIVLTTLDYAAKDPSCCPSIKGSTRFVLVNGTLHEQPATAQR